VYNLRVSNAVGVIGVLGRRQIEVMPKIPLSHLVYLMGKAEYLPRLDEQRAEVEVDKNLLELLARWYVKAAERLLRRGLINDYSPRRDFLAAKRGHLNAVQTGRAYYVGRIGFACEFDEFNVDTPLNRVVREGAAVVLRNPSLSREIRREALRIRTRMDGVSAIRVGDLGADMDRRSMHYAPALPLAKQLIRAEGRSLRSGARDTWSFLVRTPDVVEAGVRTVLSEGLGARWSVAKRSVSAIGANVSFNPDLVFGSGIAVGDVKYKVQGADWNRADLNQILAFVAAYDCQHGAVFSFREPGQDALPSLVVGSQHIRSITWPASDEVAPQVAAREVVVTASTWLTSVAPSDEHIAA